MSRVFSPALHVLQRPDCVAGHVRLELRNVVANYPFERSHRFPEIQPNSGHGDYSRLSCGAGDTQLGPRTKISASGGHSQNRSGTPLPTSRRNMCTPATSSVRCSNGSTSTSLRLHGAVIATRCYASPNKAGNGSTSVAAITQRSWPNENERFLP